MEYDRRECNRIKQSRIGWEWNAIEQNGMEQNRIEWNGMIEMKSLFFKADSLKHKSQIINSMQKKDHKQLWLGLNNGNTIIIALSVHDLCILREHVLNYSKFSIHK